MRKPITNTLTNIVINKLLLQSNNESLLIHNINSFIYKDNDDNDIRDRIKYYTKVTLEYNIVITDFVLYKKIYIDELFAEYIFFEECQDDILEDIKNKMKWIDIKYRITNDKRYYELKLKYKKFLLEK